MTAAVPLSIDDLGWFFEDHHHAVAEVARAAAAALAGEHDPARIARRMGELGLYRFLAPEGRPDVRALCLVREALGHAAPLADAIFAVQGLGLHPILAAAPPAIRAALVPAAVAGERILGFALTEPEAGSDVAALRTTARREGDDWVLSGEKAFISNVGIAHAFIVFANANPSAGRKGITAFLVPADAPGLTTEQQPLSIDHPIGKLLLRDCRVTGLNLLGEVGQGLKLALGTLDAFRVSVGAAAVGMARRALDEALAHVGRRVQFGKVLAAQPMVQAQLAEMATELDAARLLVLRAARLRDGGEDRTPVETAVAQLYATEAAQRIIDRAVQLHGGTGVLSSSVVEHLYREIRPLRIYEGTSEIQHLIIGRALAERVASKEALA